MKFFILLGDTGFLGSAFSRILFKKGKSFVGLNQKSLSIIEHCKKTEIPRTTKDVFAEIRPFLSNDSVIINTIWAHNSKSSRDSISQMDNYVREVSLIDRLKDLKLQYLSFGSIAEIDEPEISPSRKTQYALAKVLVAEHLLESGIMALWVRIASAYGPNDRRDWLIPQLLNSWSIGQDLFLENPTQVINLCHVDEIVKKTLDLVDKECHGAFNAASEQWLTIEAVKECVKSLEEPSYLERNFGAFSNNDPCLVRITSIPISDYFAKFQQTHRS